MHYFGPANTPYPDNLTFLEGGADVMMASDSERVFATEGFEVNFT